MKALQDFLRPEFINRVDEIVYFHQLTEDNFKAIAGLMLRELKDSLAERHISLTWEDSLLDYLVKKSYSAAYGLPHLGGQPAGLPGEEVLLRRLRRPEPAPPHPEGAGGRHRRADHQQLAAPGQPDQRLLRRGQPDFDHGLILFSRPPEGGLLFLSGKKKADGASGRPRPTGIIPHGGRAATWGCSCGVPGSRFFFS